MAVEYQGCHLVIPVTEQVFYQFTFLQMLLAMKIPDACGPKITLPHVSVWYLGKAHLDEVDKVVEVAKGASHLLKGQQLIIGGWGTFDGETGVLYWKVEYPNAIVEFRKRLEDKLSIGANLPFNPHLTLVEKVESRKGRIFLKNPPADVRAIIERQRITFPIKYLALWSKNERGNPSLPTQSLALIEV